MRKNKVIDILERKLKKGISYAAIILGHIGTDRAFEILLYNFQNERWNKHDQSNIIRAIAKFKGKRDIVIPILFENLEHHRSAEVRSTVVSELEGYFQEKDVPEALIRRLWKDTSKSVNNFAYQILLDNQPSLITSNLIPQLKLTYLDWEYYTISYLPQVMESDNQVLVDYFITKLQTMKHPDLSYFADNPKIKDDRILYLALNDYWWKRKSQKIILNFGEKALPAIIEKAFSDVTSGYYFNCKKMIDFIEENYGENAINQLKNKILQHLKAEKKYHIRLAMIEALGSIGSPDVKDTLLEQLQKPNIGIFNLHDLRNTFYGIRGAYNEIVNQKNLYLISVINSIGKLRISPSQDLLDIIYSQLENKDKEVKRSASEALCGFGDARGIEPLFIILFEDKKRGTFHGGDHLSNVLLNVKSDATNLLLSYRKRKEFVQWDYVIEDWLFALNPDSLFFYYCDRLDDDNSYIRNKAAKRLGEIGNPQAISILKNAIKGHRNFWYGWSKAHESLEILRGIEIDNRVI